MTPSKLDPVARLAEAALALTAAQDRVDYLVAVCRQPGHLYSDGQVHTWAEVGAALGVTRQSAQSKYRDLA